MRAEQWLPLAEAHRRRVEPFIAGRLERRGRGQRNAVEDFLFDYYPYSPGRLATWHPGFGIVLEGPPATAYLERSGYCAVASGVTADIDWLTGREARLALAISILERTADREPVTGCFALHEWAMVYGQAQDEVRHTQLPLRLTPTQISTTVQELGLRCTHIDAYRFFTPDAVPLNALTPTRATQPQLEQPGCIHAAMDLYKYAFWFAPLVSSDLIADCFEHAAWARRLDMRASPYDVTRFGLEAIRVETPEGRREYAEHQRALMAATAPLRLRLRDTLVGLQDAHRAHASAGDIGARSPD